MSIFEKAFKCEVGYYSMSQKITRTPTGIQGIDDILGGGIPSGSFVLLSGSCGTGKSIFGMHFLYEGVKKYKEKGIFISLEEKPDDLIRLLSPFDWDLANMKDKLYILKPEKKTIGSLISELESVVKQTNAKRLVIDSLSLLSSLYEQNEYKLREGVSILHEKLKEWGLTTLAISDVAEKSNKYSISGFEEFLADGVIVFRIISKQTGGSHIRAVFIRKMRGVNHSLDIFPMTINNKGITVYKDAQIFEQDY